MKQITNDDHAVLTAFAKQYGRNWKSALRQMWATANYHDFNIHFGDDAQILHRLRNTHGPAWLVRFRLTELNWHPLSASRHALPTMTSLTPWMLRPSRGLLTADLAHIASTAGAGNSYRP